MALVRMPPAGFRIIAGPEKNDRFANQDSIGAFAKAPHQFQGCRPDFQNGASSRNPNSNHARDIPPTSEP
jgi:hypothetical protein